MKIFVILVSLVSLLFSLDMQVLQEKAKSKDTKFFVELLSKTEVYYDLSDIPADLKSGDFYMTENDYGSREFYIIGEKGDSKEFQNPFFLKILKQESGGSSFSNMFSATPVKEYSPATTTKTFKPYVSNTKAIRIAILEIPNKIDTLERLVNDYLINHAISSDSVMNIQVVNDKEKKDLWIFYRP